MNITTKVDTMNINGFVVVIDDEIESTDDSDVKKIVAQIKSRHIPVVTYTELPNDNAIEHFRGASFIILDWKLTSADMVGDVPSALYGLDNAGETANIDFLKNLFKKLFVPVFIFTSQATDNIVNKLSEEGLLKTGQPDFIFVKSKNELLADNLFSEIEQWINDNPPVYALKTWENEYNKAVNQAFLAFYGINPSWITLLATSFKDDGVVNVSMELMSVIRENILSRMNTKGLKEEILLPESLQEQQKNESNLPDTQTQISASYHAHLRPILSSCRLLQKDFLAEDEVRCGDIFLYKTNKLLINIRPDCDCVPNRCSSNSRLDDIDMYLLEGRVLTGESGKFNSDYGKFDSRTNEEIVFCLFEDKTYSFNLKNLIIKNFGEVKLTRIGRLLPPFLTSLQKNYSHYLHREGLPRIHPGAIKKDSG